MGTGTCATLYLSRYAFLVTPYLGGLVKAIVDAILGVGLGLAAASIWACIGILIVQLI